MSVWKDTPEGRAAAREWGEFDVTTETQDDLAINSRDWSDLLASLQRVAIALEQHTLALLDRPDPFADLVPLEPDQLPPPHLPPVGGAVAQAPVVSPAPVTVAPQNLVCPVHKKPFRDGKYGWYCPTKNADDSWCKQKP